MTAPELAPCPLQIGDVVKLSPDFKYASEWRGDWIIVGMRWEYQRVGKINIEIASVTEIEDRNGPTDGFSIEDFEIVNQRASAPPAEPVLQPSREVMAALKAAQTKLQHTSTCRNKWFYEEEPGCSCGVTEVLAQLDAAIKAAQG